MKFFATLVLVCTSLYVSALDREAFTFTKYDLEVRVEPEQQRLGVRGKITVRNDSDSPQKNAALQISSTLNWSSIQIENKPVEFVTQTYNSDIDHTGALSEAIVTFPQPVAPKQTIELAVGYEGVIPQDATRLTRIGVPSNVAKHSDWDQISRSFIAVRGIGNVAWYPIAAEAASLSEGNSVFEAVGRSKQREDQSVMRVDLCLSGSDSLPTAMMNEKPTGVPTSGVGGITGNPVGGCTEHAFPNLGRAVPTIVAANYSDLEQPDARIHYFPEHRSGAENYVLALQSALPFVTEWFGAPREKPEVAELADPDAAPFESGNMLLMPLIGTDSRRYQLAAVQQLTHMAFPSSRAWIHEGLARFAQLGFIQKMQDPQAVIEYLENHRDALVESEKQNLADGTDKAAEHSLINAADEFYVQAKAMNVWWMLKDMVGETALKSALHNYRPADDKEPSYLQKLIQAQTHRDLEWFFDDWVYRDRGLPDFKVDSVYPRQLVNGGYMVTVTVENLGSAGAEVPVTLHMNSGEASERLMVPGKSKASVRIQAATVPVDVTVNDGSVPESDMSNNIFKLQVTPVVN
jgi:hypothetical protein